MTKKTISFKKVADLREEAEKKIDDWIGQDEKVSQTPVQPITEQPELTQNEKREEEESRFTVVMPVYLHKRIKKQCVIEEITMRDKLVEIFLSEFPES